MLALKKIVLVAACTALALGTSAATHDEAPQSSVRISKSHKIQEQALTGDVRDLDFASEVVSHINADEAKNAAADDEDDEAADDDEDDWRDDASISSLASSFTSAVTIGTVTNSMTPTPAPKPATPAVTTTAVEHRPLHLELSVCFNDDYNTIRVGGVKGVSACVASRVVRPSAMARAQDVQTGSPMGSYCDKLASGKWVCKPEPETRRPRL